MNGPTHCPNGHTHPCNCADADWLFGDTTFGPTRAQIAEAEREERRRDIGDKWEEDYLRSVALGLEDPE